MVAVFTKEMLSWYLITLKLKDTIDSNLQIPSTSSPPSSSTQLVEPSQHQQRHTQQRSLLNLPLSPLRAAVTAQQQQNRNDSAQSHQQEPDESPPSQESPWVISIREKLDQARNDDVSTCWSKLCIYRIPTSLRSSGDIKAYVPHIVSIGPYHHGRMSLKEMDRHKWRALQHVVKRTGQDINLYLDSMRELEDKARACYEGPLNLTTNEFVEMMVLDGCFLLEIFRGTAEGFAKLGYARNDPVFSMRGTMHSIRRDMVMLENQLPLFILDRLLDIQLSLGGDQKGLVAKLALVFFDPLNPTDEPLTDNDRSKMMSWINHAAEFDPLSDQAGLHCLDVFRRSILRVGPQPAARKWFRRWPKSVPVVDKRRQQLVHCVTEMKEAGVKFRKRKTDRFWDVKFENGVLYMPRILVHDGTKSLFFNLIAFEQCHLDCSNDITSYVIFLDNLIDSNEDVSYLHYHGIMEHWLGNDAEVADLFNRLCQEVVFDYNDSYLAGLSDEVNKYYNHKWNAWRAALRHKYFNNPWAIISFIAAVFLILLTFGQTFYGIYAFYKPPS